MDRLWIFSRVIGKLFDLTINNTCKSFRTTSKQYLSRQHESADASDILYIQTYINILKLFFFTSLVIWFSASLLQFHRSIQFTLSFDRQSQKIHHMTSTGSNAQSVISRKIGVHTIYIVCTYASGLHTRNIATYYALVCTSKCSAVCHTNKSLPRWPWL